MPSEGFVDGVSTKQNDLKTVILCIIKHLSDELKDLIRMRLSSICFGTSTGESNKDMYSYKNTLKEFLGRYKTKTPDTKKGMIGELLSHILLPEIMNNIRTISPFFNLEEKSIKKGFDIIFIDTAKEELLFTEVKSGNVTDKQSSNNKNDYLLKDAKKDIQTKLNDNNSSIWHNSIHGARIALYNNKNIKKTVVDILEDYLSDVQKESQNSNTKNVILVSVLYNHLADKITIEQMQKFKSALDSENIFNYSIVFSIQKNTYEKIESFLETEAIYGK